MTKKISGATVSPQVLSVVVAKKRSDGLTQQEVVVWFQDEHHITISQPEISRLEKEAVDTGYLRRDPSFIPGKVPSGLLAKARALYAHEPMTKAVDQWIGSGRKVKIEVEETDDESEFAGRAGSWLVNAIQRHPSVRGLGVLWSRTLNNVVKEIAKAYEGHPPCPRDAFPNLRCVPLCGDPVYQDELATVDCSASVLAARLELALTGSCTPNAPSLGGVWAYLKSSPSRELHKAHVAELPNYRRIFQPGDGLLHTLDAILTGVGIVDLNNEVHTGTFVREMIQQGDSSYERIDATTHGDIGGSLVMKEGLRDDQIEHVEMLNNGLTGIRYADFQTVASRAPGVLVIAASHLKKGRLLLQLAKEGVANEMFIDGILATEMSRILREELKVASGPAAERGA